MHCDKTNIRTTLAHAFELEEHLLVLWLCIHPIHTECNLQENYSFLYLYEHDKILGDMLGLVYRL